MPEDKLSLAQRVRLEALAQAQATIASIGISPTEGPHDVTETPETIRNRLMNALLLRAEMIEEWLWKAKPPSPPRFSRSSPSHMTAPPPGTSAGPPPPSHDD